MTSCIAVLLCVPRSLFCLISALRFDAAMGFRLLPRRAVPHRSRFFFFLRLRVLQILARLIFLIHLVD